MFPAWAIVHNANFVPIFVSAGGVNAWAGVLLIMVIALSGVQFGLKSNAWLQNRTTAKRECDL